MVQTISRLLLFHSNAFGDYLVHLGPEIVWNLMDKADLSLAHRRTLLLQIALLKFHRAKGEFPEDLKYLVPDYLDAVPLDPADGAPIRYDKARGAVWVMGSDLRDDGGAPASKEHGFDRSKADPTLFVLPREDTE